MKCLKCGAQLPDGAKFCGSCGCKVEVPAQAIAPRKPTAPVSQPTQKAVTVEPDHGAAAARKGKLPLLILGVVILLVVLAVVFFGMLGGGSHKDAYILLKDGHYQLLTNLNKGNLIDIASLKSDDDTSGIVRFSKDGKYIYFFTKYNDDTNTGTLCRTDYGKLKANSSKNDQYIETIASNAQTSITQMKDNTLLYFNGDNTLYYFDGKGSTQIAKNVTDVRCPDSKNDNEVLYIRNKDGSEEGELYYLSLDKPEDPVKLDGHISGLVLYNDLNNLIYTRTNDSGEDDLYVTGLNKDPEKIASRIRTLYTDSKNGRVFYQKMNGKTVSSYDFVNDPYKVTTEPSWSDYYNNGKYDNDGYNKAWNHYNIRQTLMSSDHDVELSDIYCLESGEVTLIAEDVLSTDHANGGFIYWGEDVFEDGFDIDDIDYGMDVSSALKYLGGNAADVMDMTEITVYNGLTNQSFPLADTQDEDFTEELSNGYLILTSDGALFRNWIDSTLMSSSMENGTLGKFSRIAESASVLLTEDDAIYYTADAYQQNGVTYADLYSYSKGESARIAQDIVPVRIRMYDDGQTYVYTDTGSHGYELTCINKDGAKNTIADDVQQYLRPNQTTLLYISDGDLYSYNGKEKNRVATDVDYVWATSTLSSKSYYQP